MVSWKLFLLPLLAALAWVMLPLGCSECGSGTMIERGRSPHALALSLSPQRHRAGPLSARARRAAPRADTAHAGADKMTFSMYFFLVFPLYSVAASAMACGVFFNCERSAGSGAARRSCELSRRALSCSVYPAPSRKVVLLLYGPSLALQLLCGLDRAIRCRAAT